MLEVVLLLMLGAVLGVVGIHVLKALEKKVKNDIDPPANPPAVAVSAIPVAVATAAVA